MISPRFLAVLAITLAVTAAFPADQQSKPIRPITTIEDDFEDGSWLGVSLFGNLFAPLWRLFPNFNDIGPKISTDNDKFEVAVNVKNYKKEDLKVKVKGDFLYIQGSHSTSQDEHDLFASQFFQSYSLPINASAADLTSELTSDGFLVVKAPINGEKSENVERDVPITETGKPFKEEKPIKEGVDKEEEDRKEETTPASQKESEMEKENTIPNGNEDVISP